MLKKSTALILASAFASSSVYAGPTPARAKLRNVCDVITDRDSEEFIARVSENGVVDLALVEQELALANGEEETWIIQLLSILALGAAKSCENDWSMRKNKEGDICVGHCDDAPKPDYQAEANRQRAERQHERDQAQRRLERP